MYCILVYRRREKTIFLYCYITQIAKHERMQNSKNKKDLFPGGMESFPFANKINFYWILLHNIHYTLSLYITYILTHKSNHFWDHT